MAPVSSTIPLFAINMLLLPGEQVPLHVFEPRYQQLFNEVEQLDSAFALPYSDESIKIASKCRLVRVTRREKDGKRDVLVECTALFALVSEQPRMKDKLYPGGDLGEEIKLYEGERASVTLLESFADYIELKFGKRPILEEIMHYKPIDVAACITLDVKDKIKIINATSDEAKEAMLMSLLKYLRFLFYQEAQAENGIILN